MRTRHPNSFEHRHRKVSLYITTKQAVITQPYLARKMALRAFLMAAIKRTRIYVSSLSNASDHRHFRIDLFENLAPYDPAAGP